VNPKKIAFYGLFGQQNWGNECTLQAIIYHVRRQYPDAELRCFCTDPEDTSRRHNIAAYPASYCFTRGSRVKSSKKVNPVINLLQKTFVRIPKELASWIEAYKSLQGFDMLIVPGTGLLTDFSSNSLGIPYRLFKWSLAAKACRCKLLFMSVGAGPMYQPLTRRLIKAALSLADYRSYRDSYSKQFVQGIGFKADGDPIYPDLAFSLPADLFPTCDQRDKKRTVIGVGVKDYCGVLGLPEHGGDEKYYRFISKLDIFVTTLLERGYEVRLLIGDQLYDNKVKQDLMDLLQRRGVKPQEGQITNEPIASVAEVLSQIAACDIVVSARFHNVLLALMLNKPAISLSYHDKFACLMAGVGLGSYCHDIDDLAVDALAGQIVELEANAATIKPRIRQKVEEYRIALDGQYARVLQSGQPAVLDQVLLPVAKG